MSERIELTVGPEAERLVSQVRERYARIAEGKEGLCCGPQTAGSCASEDAISLSIGYNQQELAQAPEDANLGLGCGAPLRFLGLAPGETVLDLGSGPGLDAFLAAREVGPTGHVIGVDMTPAMLEKARRGATRAGLSQVEFREGRLEALPVADASVDAVTSNCVINLVPDKAAVFKEVARVLRPGGRLVVSDVILDGELPASVASDVFAYVGCVAGAMQRTRYFEALRQAGLLEVEVLRDVDFLVTLEAAAPDEVKTILERTGAYREQLVGKVRSVTYRARKA